MSFLLFVFSDFKIKLIFTIKVEYSYIQHRSGSFPTPDDAWTVVQPNSDVKVWSGFACTEFNAILSLYSIFRCVRRSLVYGAFPKSKQF
jgi:hypothetical protein